MWVAHKANLKLDNWRIVGTIWGLMLGLSKCTISSVSTWKTSADQSDAMLCGYPRQFDKIRITQKEHKLERKVLAFFFVGNEYE